MPNTECRNSEHAHVTCHAEGPYCWPREDKAADQLGHLDQTHPEAAALMRQGWTLDSALAHVEGSCDIALCTHPTHKVAELGAELADLLAPMAGLVEVEEVTEWRALDSSGAQLVDDEATFHSVEAAEWAAHYAQLDGQVTIQSRTVYLVRGPWA